MFWVHNIPVEGEECKWIYERSIIYLKGGERYEFVIHHRSYTHNLRSCEIKAWKKFRPEQDLNPWPLPTNWAVRLHVSGSNHV